MFQIFLGKKVLVEAGGYRILGILKAVERSPIDRHPPLVLIVENQGSLRIVRGCVSVRTVKKLGNNKEEK
jgi:hypothetical protein